MSIMDPKRVRNVGIWGHGGVGKTMLIEHLLHDAGVTQRMGSIEEGSTVCDYLEEEKEHGHTITMKLSHLEWHKARIHFIDHPGYADFVGEMAASAPILDGVVIMVDASTGPQVGTDNAWKYCERHKIPRAFFVNKLDRDHTDFNTVVEAIRETYGKQCVPLVVPVGQGQDLKETVNIFEGDTHEIADEIAKIKEGITDAVAETDDALMEKYLDGAELTPDEFHQGLHDGITDAKIMPIIAGSVVKNYGVDELLDVIADSFPCPMDRHVMVNNGKAEMSELAVGGDEPFLGQVFRSVADPFVGHLTFFRVLTGTLKSDGEFYNVTRDEKERTGKLFLLNGKEQRAVDEVGPGDLAAMTKLKHTHFGDTIAAPGSSYTLPEIEMPHSVVKRAIHPKTRNDEDKLGDALHKLTEEEPTFKHYRDDNTSEHIVQGTGDLQLDIFMERLKNKYKVEVDSTTPKVAYRETVRGRADVQGKHKKQSGGHGQYGDVHLKISSNTRGEGFQFKDSIVGGVVPKQYIPAVEKGSQEALAKGVISGHPVVDVVVELYDGTFHNVDSSEMAFKIAASTAIRKGVQAAQPCILEPVVEISVTVPEDCMGDVTGDLNSKRGRILGVEPIGGGRQRITANVPEVEILRYSADLRSMSSGRGSYDLEFSHYDDVPEHVAKKIVEEYEKEKAEGH